MSRLDNTPQPVRDAIAAALMIGCLSATMAALLHQPLFLVAGFAIFALVYFLRIGPQIKQVYKEQAENDPRYADDATYEPLLERFADDHDDDALIDAYKVWSQGPHENEVRMRFLQEAIAAMINAGKIYRIEELMDDMERYATAEGLEDRFKIFRTSCDEHIAKIAQARLASAEEANA